MAACIKIESALHAQIMMGNNENYDVLPFKSIKHMQINSMYVVDTKIARATSPTREMIALIKNHESKKQPTTSNNSPTTEVRTITIKKEQNVMKQQATTSFAFQARGGIWYHRRCKGRIHDVKGHI